MGYYFVNGVGWKQNKHDLLPRSADRGQLLNGLDNNGEAVFSQSTFWVFGNGWRWKFPVPQQTRKWPVSEFASGIGTKML